MKETKRHGFGRAFFLALLVLGSFLGAWGDTPCIAQSQAAAQAQQAVAQARFYAQAELTRQALEVLEPLRANPQIRVEIARILFAAQDWQTAAQEYSALLKEFPGQEVLQRNLLVSLYRARRDGEARELLAVMGEQAAKHPRTLTIRGLLAEREGRREAAVADLQAAAQLDPEDTFAPYEHGVLLLAAGEAAAAVQPLREAIRRDAGMAQAHYNLGQALIRSGARDEGRRAMERSQEIAGEINAERTRRIRAVALAQRAREAAQAGDQEKALQDLDQALELLPGDADLRALRDHLAGGGS